MSTLHPPQTRPLPTRCRVVVVVSYRPILARRVQLSLPNLHLSCSIPSHALGDAYSRALLTRWLRALQGFYRRLICRGAYDA